MPLPIDNNEDETVEVFSQPIPSAIPSPVETDTLIAQQMSQLSVNDRQQVVKDIYGFVEEIDETKEMIRKNLSKLQKELKLIKQKAAYNMAHAMNPSYVENDEFRLMFLRADKFDTKAAALRMARHFEVKMELFGREKLARDIIQDDLEEQALSSLYSGVSQWLPRRDGADRVVLARFRTVAEGELDGLAKLQRTFYYLMVTASDVESQKKGVVGVGAILSHVHDNEREWVFKLLQVMKGLPIRIEALHFCYNSLRFLPIFALLRLSASLFIRLRICAHYGTPSEYMKKLEAFGIPVDTFPVSEDGEILTDNLKEMLEKRRNVERSDAAAPGVVVPRRLDVLFGRGKGSHEHDGNVRFRMLVGDCKARYDKASKEEKTRLSEEIVNIVKQVGGRFLKDDDKVGWVVVDDITARGKVSQLFRTFRVVKEPSERQKAPKSDRKVKKKGEELPPAKRFCADETPNNEG